jgi:hypothetical protein
MRNKLFQLAMLGAILWMFGLSTIVVSLARLSQQNGNALGYGHPFFGLRQLGKSAVLQ